MESLNKKLISLFKFAFIALCFYYLYRFTDSNFIDIFAEFKNINAPLITLAFVFASFQFVCIFFVWQAALRSNGIYEKHVDVFSLFSVSTLAKYLPGGIWQVGSRFFGLSNKGHSVKSIGISIFIEQFSGLIAIGICVIAFLYFIDFSKLPFNLLGIFFTSLLVVFILIPIGIYSLKQRFRSLFALVKKSKLNNKLRYTMQIIILQILANIFLASSYLFCFYAVDSGANLFWAESFGYCFLAVLSGFLVFFAPAGLGVREGILVIFLAQYFPSSQILLAATLPRFATVVSEIFLYFLSKLLLVLQTK